MGTSTPQPAVQATLAKELSLGKPFPFDGNRGKARRFIEIAEDYVEGNSHIYTTDDLKILWILQYLQEGEAANWASGIRSKAKKRTPTSYGTFNQFLDDFKKAFISVEDISQARAELQLLKQGTGSVDEYNTKFQTLMARAQYSNEDDHCIVYRMGLRPGILSNIARTGNLPTTLEVWYTTASRIDRAEQEIKMVQNHNQQPAKEGNRSKGNRNYQNNNNAPRVAKLTPEERERCIKEGRCFRCREKGHNSANCPGPTNTSRNIRAADTTPETPPDPKPEKETSEDKPPKEEANPMGPTELATHIRRLMAGMNQESKDQFFAEMEKEGF